MTSCLGLMGIQQWEVRSDMVAKPQEDSSVELFEEVSNLDIQIQVEKPALELDSLDTNSNEVVETGTEIEHETIQPESNFYVYAAVSLRQHGNIQKRWLWIVDQPSLSREELKLLDNIVTATDSEWAESGLADGYMGDGQLRTLLDDNVSEVVLFGSKHVEFFANQSIFVTSSISKLVSDTDKKRETWQGLKQLML